MDTVKGAANFASAPVARFQSSDHHGAPRRLVPSSRHLGYGSGRLRHAPSRLHSSTRWHDMSRRKREPTAVSSAEGGRSAIDSRGPQGEET